jgi:FAD dependent oxidoreductase
MNRFITLIFAFFFFTYILKAQYKADVIIYGGNSAAIMAAIQTHKMGKTAIVVCPDEYLGGLTTNGLGFTDTGNKSVIGGLAKSFYQGLYQYYQTEKAWKWENKENFGNKGQNTVALDGETSSMWIFEPSAASYVLNRMIQQSNLIIHKNEWLNRSSNGIKLKDNRIISITMLSGKSYQGAMFIDATYEGDLMALAGVNYTIGRESNIKYEEKWNGVQTGVFQHAHYFKHSIDPYIIKGYPKSGLLPEITNQKPAKNGKGDEKIQAYCYRLCMSDHPDNKIPFPKPSNYDPRRYELLKRTFEAGWTDVFSKFDRIPNRKTDTNNHGPFSSDYIGKNYAYPEADYETRKKIIEDHKNYQQGYLYFLANDSSVPRNVQDKFNQWGLAKDEFVENGNWPYQLYIREARRMIGSFVMTEKDALGQTYISKPIGMGSYHLDSHNTQRFVTAEGYVQNEGDIGVKPDRPYSIDYGAIIPKEKDCQNLLVPVCLSSSHIAYGSIRMEPVFMILGQSAATAAVLSIQNNTSVQKLPYEILAKQLLKDLQVLRHP